MNIDKYLEDCAVPDLHDLLTSIAVELKLRNLMMLGNFTREEAIAIIVEDDGTIE